MWLKSHIQTRLVLISHQKINELKSVHIEVFKNLFCIQKNVYSKANNNAENKNIIGNPILSLSVI